MRVGILGIQHESNTFVAKPTTLADFEADRLLRGQQIVDACAKAHHETGGFLEGLERERIEPVPLFFARATPGGTIARDADEQLIERALEALDQAGPLDGLLVAPHGAAVSERHRDFDGHWLTLVRQRLGPKVPIVCTLDPHANVSRRMIQTCDATIAYRTNPHVDQRETGLTAARLIARHLEGRIKLTQALTHPPVAISMDKQETAARPCSDLYALANDVQERSGVLSDSVILGFPYADVEEMGSAFIVVTDDEPDRAHRYANELADWLREHHHRFACDLPGVEQAVREAAETSERICLLDVGDNVGGGSPADGTLIALELHKQYVDRSFVCLFDPEAVKEAKAAGVGAECTLAMGGKTDRKHGKPFTTDVTVRKLHDGHFSEDQPRHGGRSHWDMGPSVVVETERGMTILLNSIRTPPFSLGQITGMGLDPQDFRVFVAKGVNAPIAAYKPVVDRFIRVNTPGVTAADMTTFTYKYRPKPLFPFEGLDAAPSARGR